MSLRIPRVLCAVLGLTFACSSLLHAAEDQIELLTGVKIHGRVVAQTDKDVTISTQGAEMAFPLAKVHALTVNNQRKILNEKAAAPKPVPKPAAKPAAQPAPAPAPEPAQAAKPAQPAAQAAAAKTNGKPRAEVDALINQAGPTPPDWWNAVKLNYPPSLDLSWPDKAPGGWNASKNIGQYFWSVINENPSRWKDGVKFAAFLAQKFQSDPHQLDKAMGQMAHLYQDCLEDYARAAYLRKKMGKEDVELAVCYFKLGSHAASAEILRKIGADYTRHGSVIKLWADMGELDTALKLAEQKAGAGMEDIAFLMAGDACRMAGRYNDAVNYYQRVLSAGRVGRDIKQSKARAQASMDAIKLFDALDLRRIPDGSYSSDSYGYSGQVHVAVTVSGARIAEVKVTKHQEKQYYGALEETPRRIVEKQSVKGIDTFSSATITSEAIVNASAKALSSGMK